MWPAGNGVATAYLLFVNNFSFVKRVARKEALVGAKKVHSFDKRIDDTLDWILEKEALLTIDVNCQDEETIQEMKQKQLGIRQDVKAINEQVCLKYF